MTFCAICDIHFEAKTSYGLCSACINSTTLKEFDRVEAAIRQARREGFSATLDLKTWLSIQSDFNGKCAYCLDHFAYYIERVDPNKGLDKDNVVPVCGACHIHKVHGFDRATKRVAEYLAGNVTFRVEMEDTNFRVPVELWGKA